MVDLFRKDNVEVRTWLGRWEDGSFCSIEKGLWGGEDMQLHGMIVDLRLVTTERTLQ